MKYLDNLERKHQPRGEVKKYFIKALLPPILFGFISGGVLGAIFRVLAPDYKSKQPVSKLESCRIDRDELSDLVMGNKILLANQTDEGIVYRPLKDSDIYRIR